MKLIKIIPVVLMGIFLSANARAITINHEESVYPGSAVQIESWMFDTNYLSNIASTVEAWMFSDRWLDQEAGKSVVESWMLDSDYLISEAQSVEPWMLDSDYLSVKTDNLN